MMLPGDCVAMRMTGEIRTTPPGLSEGILWDFEDDRRADIVLDRYGIPPELRRRDGPTFSVQGGLRSGAAASSA